MNIEGLPDNTDTGQVEIAPPPDAGWLVAAANILVWAFFALAILMLIPVVFYILKRLLAWLLSKDSQDAPSFTFQAWVRNFMKSLLALPAALWRFCASAFKQVDSAAMVYVRLLKWGQHSGVLKRHNETPDEYAGRLMRLFPRLSRDIRLIVDSFNQEVYGLVQTTPDMLADIQKAQHRMKNIRYWPLRAKVWLVS
jgi:hypothetical protein